MPDEPVSRETATAEEKVELLIRRSQAGNREALQQILEPLQSPVYRFLRRYLEDCDARDVAQNTFILVVKKIDQFEFKSTLRGWVFSIAYRQMLNFKKSKFNRELPGELNPEDLAIFQWTTESDDRSHEVLTLIDQLTPVQREVVWLRIREGLTFREIATLKKLPLNTILSRMHQAKLKLAGKLKQIGISVGGNE